MTAAVNGENLSVEFALTNVAGSGAKLTVISGNNQSATWGTAFSAPMVVELDDAFGNPVSGATVTFTAPASDPTATLSTPAADGIERRTSVTATAGAVAGAYAVTVSAAGAASTTVALNNVAGNGSTILVVSGTPQSATVATAFGAALVVQVEDQNGNAVSGVAVNFTAPTSGASASLTTAAATDVNGETSVTATAGTVAGTYTVIATASGVGVGYLHADEHGGCCGDDRSDLRNAAERRQWERRSGCRCWWKWKTSTGTQCPERRSPTRRPEAIRRRA